MWEQVYQCIIYASPLIAGFITSTVIPLVIKSVSLKHLQKRIDEVNPSKQYEEIQRDLKDIKREIYTMRGKMQ